MLATVKRRLLIFSMSLPQHGQIYLYTAGCQSTSVADDSFGGLLQLGEHTEGWFQHPRESVDEPGLLRSSSRGDGEQQWRQVCLQGDSW